MATYTTNIGLHQWAADDNFLRTDFNTDFQKIDTAIGGKASASSVNSSIASLKSQISSLDSGKVEITTGSYAGNDSTQTISLGFKPKAVIVSGGNHCEMTTTTSSIAASYMTLTSSGFTVEHTSAIAGNPNNKGITYQYMALR